MRAGSMFSGIGGLDLGLERAGMEIVWQVENEPFCVEVLKKHWPHVPNLGDVKHIEWEHVENVDLICGGFPCQPVSLAGRRRGSDDERWLWPYMARAIRVLRPRYCLLENVPGLLVQGMGSVLGDLAEIGYDTEWDCIPAVAVGAPHLRYRVFIVAYASSAGRQQVTGSSHGDEGTDARWPAQDDHVIERDGESGGTRVVADAGSERRDGRSSIEGTRGQTTVRGEESGDVSHRSGAPDVADTNSAGLEGPRRLHVAGPAEWRQPPNGGETRDVADSNAERRVGWPRVFGPTGRREFENCRRWEPEPDVGRVAYGIPRRVDRLKSLGNAVVPQVAETIGRMIMEREDASLRV